VTIDPQHRVMLVKVPHSYKSGDDSASLYEAARRWWVIGEPRRNNTATSPRFALPVADGHVIGAFTIDGWEPDPDSRRWGFHGSISDELTAQYTGTSAPTTRRAP
jgi:hypothetical protein